MPINPDFLIQLIGGEDQEDKNILQATKSMHYLEIITQVKDKLDDLENRLLNDAFKYYGKLPELG